MITSAGPGAESTSKGKEKKTRRKQVPWISQRYWGSYTTQLAMESGVLRGRGGCCGLNVKSSNAGLPFVPIGLNSKK